MAIPMESAWERTESSPWAATFVSSQNEQSKMATAPAAVCAGHARSLYSPPTVLSLLLQSPPWEKRTRRFPRSSTLPLQSPVCLFFPALFLSFPPHCARARAHQVEKINFRVSSLKQFFFANLRQKNRFAFVLEYLEERSWEMYIYKACAEMCRQRNVTAHEKKIFPWRKTGVLLIACPRVWRQT